MKSLHKKRVLLFLLLLVCLTDIINSIPLLSNYQDYKSLLLMWIPGIAAIIVAFSTGVTLKSFGWKFSTKWITLAWLIPIIYGSIAYSLVWVFELGDSINPTFIAHTKLSLDIKSNYDSVVIGLSFLYITIACLLPNMLLFLGEELGWRGFLIPELSKWGSVHNASWISAVIWTIWQLPEILSGNYANSDIPIWYQVFCFSIMTLSTGVILAYLRMMSKSIWPAVVCHAIHNSIIQRFFDRLTLDTGMTNLFIGEFGIVLALVTAAFAIYYYKRLEHQALAKNLTYV
ncbi:CPBP family intramembrane glutamic endopeptidase [Geojedonia litorea]|uniref:CPBP family intramembrane glutamic endopeptidase n=1 Tax=Geojedonia litorea TaxID=1268269 RepID=A0ABV9N9D2_9FLAO